MPSLGSKISSGEQNRVLTHCIEIFTWLEELASESNTIQAQGSGSKNLLQRAILYMHKELLLRREDSSFKPGETMCTFWSVFSRFLKMNVFVWVRVVCGVRTHHSGSGNAGPAPGKIHEKDPERAQGYSKYDNIDEFHDLRQYLASKMSSGEQNRVLTHSIERFRFAPGP